MKYRVLHILHSLNMGGAENFIMNIYRNINRNEIQFDFLVHKRGYFENEVMELGGKVHYLEGYVTDVGIKRYKKLLVNFFQSEVGMEYKIVHVHVNQTSGLIIPIIKKTSGAICFSHCHDLQNYNNFLVSIYKKYLQFRLNKYTDYRLACSQPAGEWLYGDHEFSVINNGIELGRFKFSEAVRANTRKKLGISDEDILLGHVGRFEKVKNQEFLVEFFKKELFAQNYKLLLIGEGSLKGQIEEKVDSLGLSNEIYFRPVTSELVKYYDAMDIFVLPSIKEALGIVAIEAQANGLPVIASNGVAREMKVSEDVEFVALNSVQWRQQVERFGKILSNNNIKRTQVEINTEYDIKKSVRKLTALYDDGVDKYENTH